jgi:adenylate cyclase
MGMSLKTENLAIVLTDIVGYTETTAHQSRHENEKLLDTHNQILLPIVRRFKGRLIKSIGDALLMVFRSPTDAMLCGMAMQDALFEYNRGESEERQIHIRVAASLGEVRVTRNDIFGEPVNTTSRIESITPKDEIYFSEAIYMAMNKAEVPCKEVGWKELKGISQPIRIFNIPRFSTPRLVPEDVMAAEDISDLVYPFGGAHLQSNATTQDTSGFARFGESGSKIMVTAAGLLLAGLAAAGGYYYANNISNDAPTVVASTSENTAKAPEKNDEETKPEPAPVPEAKVVPPPPVAKVETRPEPKPAPPPKPVARPKPKPKAAPKPAPKPRPQPASRPAVESKPAPVAKAAPAPVVKKAEPELPALEFESIRDAKRAYKRDKLSKEEYKNAIRAIKLHIKAEVKPWREKLDKGEINKKEYKREYVKIRKKYE